MLFGQLVVAHLHVPSLIRIQYSRMVRFSVLLGLLLGVDAARSSKSQPVKLIIDTDIGGGGCNDVDDVVVSFVSIFLIYAVSRIHTDSCTCTCILVTPEGRLYGKRVDGQRRSRNPWSNSKHSAT